MSVNILKHASLTNVSSYTGLPRRILTRGEMKSLIGFTTATGVVVPPLTYLGLEASLPRSFFCKDSAFYITNGSDFHFQTGCKIIRQKNGPWQDVPVIFSGGIFRVDFNTVFPDMAQLIYKFQFTYVNLAPTSSVLHTWDLLSVDYPMDYNYDEFSVAASSYGNYPVYVSNDSIQGTPQDIRVMPIYSGDYALDRTFMLTASGKEDTDRYHIDRGVNVPDNIPWSSGIFDNTMVSGRYLTLTGTAVSGSWLSPAIYVSDPNFVSLYLYVENESESAGLEKDWLSINQVMDVRASDETPLPNFLINQWTQRLYTMPDGFGNILLDIPSPNKRPASFTTQEGYAPTSDYWVRDMEACAFAANHVQVGCPYLFGRSDRVYIRGDGTVVAEATPERYQIASRDYWTGIPYKIYGSINSYWNAATFIGLMGDGFGVPGVSQDNTLYNRLTFSTPQDSSLWNSGKDVGTRYFNKIYPFASYACFGSIGLIPPPIYFEYVGNTTIPKPRHPNEWIVITAVMAPPEQGAEKYMCLYLLNVRNFWTSEYKLLGIYGISQAPADEGYAVCPCSSADEDEGGFWLHVGYSANIISKFTGDGYLLNEYSVLRGYSALRESPEEGCLWAIRNDGVFYYKENTTSTEPTLDVQFKIEDDGFQYLQAGDVDDVGNLWVVDRDTSTVYRINLSNREIDYTNHIPYAVGVWPHPTDGSAFVYVGFHPDSFTTAIKRVWVNDFYQAEDLVTEVPTMPLSDWSGVQFTGKLSGSYISPGVNDPVFGTDDNLTLEWQPYVNTSPTIPPGKYKQFKLVFRRDSASIDSPRVGKVRIPAPLVLDNVPFKHSERFYINPHLRYDIKTGDFSMNLLTWWEH